MNRIRSFLWAGAAAVTLLGAGCQDEELPTGMNAAVGPAAKPVTVLKVTPSQLNLSGTGASATLTVTPGSSSGVISVGVSEPACVSVVLKSAKPNQVKYAVTATTAGSCSLLVTDGPTGGVIVPVTVTSTVQPATLVAGRFHTCGLDVNGTAYCWGQNTYGQLGNSTNLDVSTANPTPTAVAGGIAFASLTAGVFHTCGLTPAGVAYCWGANWSGQLGNTTNNSTSVANPAPLLVDGNLTFTALDAGGDHTCGLTVQGVMYCWGFNGLGELGTTTNNGGGAPNPAPTPVSGNLTFTALAAGRTHTCGVATGGATYCWGNNNSGQLGNPTAVGQSNVPQPTPALVQGIPALASIFTGADHTCGLTPAGAAWCWGSNDTGELSGTTDNPSATPVAVSGGLAFTTLTGGIGFTCGRTGASAVYCWGNNVAGQLASPTNFGTPNPTYTPLAVSGLSAVAITAEGSHACGLTAAGQAYCWGDNRYGQLGNTTNNNTGIGNPTPAVVSGVVFATP